MPHFDSLLRQVEARSQEHAKAFDLLYAAGHFGVCIGIVRQEIDSLLRLAYLWEPTVSADSARQLIESSVMRGEWKATDHRGKEVRVTDKHMLDAALTDGWESVAYDFGCRLIHLSNAHSYKEHDPMLLFAPETRKEIAKYLAFYHDFAGDDVSMSDVISYLPKVFEKVRENIEFYIEELNEKLHEGAL